MAPACEVSQHRILPEEREPCPVMILFRGPGAIEAPGEKPAPIAVSADLRSEESPRVLETQHKGSSQLFILRQASACSIEVKPY